MSEVNPEPVPLTLEQQIAMLQGQLATAQSTADQEKKDKLAAEGRVKVLEGELGQAKEKLEGLQTANPLLNQRITTLDENLRIAEKRVEALEIELQGVRKELAIAKPPVAPASSYLCRSVVPTTEDPSSNSPSVFSPKRLWSNGQVITYRFLDGHVNQQIKVTKVIPEWSRYANITFKLVSSPNALLSISFKNSLECWSHIGTDAHTTTANPPYTMALGAVSVSSDTTRADRALILHQFGHALGLVHEHMCPAGTDTVSLKQNLFFKHPSFQGLDASIGEHFSVYANGSVTNYASPDPSSIMIFFMPGELNEGNFTIEPNMDLSPLDKAFMVINYPRARVHSQASEWTLRHALSIANVDDNTARTITEEHELAKRRTLFADFLSAARQHASTDFVDPAPEMVAHLRLPSVQDALHAFFADPAKHPAAAEILADRELKEELVVLLDRLAGHRAIREIVKRGKAAQAGHEAPSPRAAGEPAFVNSLLNVALMLHGTAKHRSPASVGETDRAELKQVEAATALYTQFAQHTTFRVAMERAVGEEVSEKETTPDVSVLVARLAERPALLRAVRQALLGHVR